MKRFDVDLASRLTGLSLTVFGVPADTSGEAIDKALATLARPDTWHCTGVDAAKAPNDDAASQADN